MLDIVVREIVRFACLQTEDFEQAAQPWSAIGYARKLVPIFADQAAEACFDVIDFRCAVGSPISREAPPLRSNFQQKLALRRLGLHRE